jgi:ABC-type multidrug transport system permease subunit
MKTIVLITAMLKGFIRNYKSVVLIIVVPLLIVMSIFLAFSQEGIRGVSVGYSVDDESDIDIVVLEESIKTFTGLSRYYSHDACMNSLRSYDEYVCIRFKGTGPYVIDIHYDNTREPIIWEVLERLNQAFIFAQQRYATTMTESYLAEGKNILAQMSTYEQELDGIRLKIHDAKGEVSSQQQGVQALSNELGTSLALMQEDLREARELHYSTSRSVGQAFYDTDVAARDLRFKISALPVADEQLYIKEDALREIDDVRRDLDNRQYEINQRFDTFDNKLTDYESRISRGYAVQSELGAAHARLGSLSNQLDQYAFSISQAQGNIRQAVRDSDTLNLADPDLIVRPIRTENIPTYIPVFSEEEMRRWEQELSDEEQMMKGFSLISLQTIYPSILVLITMFLSLLISTYVTLSSINSKTYERLNLVRGITLPHFISLIISSFLIILIPVSVVLIIGGTLFRLHIMSQLFSVLAGIGLLALIIIVVGMMIALLIRKESIALTTSTFVLIIMIFYSGFLLPVERMSDGFSHIAMYSPGTLSGLIFKQAVFYNVMAGEEIAVLALQLLLLLIACFIIRLYK